MSHPIFELVGAAREGDTNKVARLLAGGISLQGLNSLVGGKAPVHWAIDNGNPEIAAMIIRAGANVDKQDARGYTPAFNAVYRGYKELLALLISKKANLEIPRTGDGWTPMIRAVANNDTDILTMLINAKADVNMATLHNETPIFRAVFCQGTFCMVQMLIAAKAHVDTAPTGGNIDDIGRTPLLRAAMLGNTGIVGILVRAHADLNSVGPDGNSPLHEAAKRGHEYIVSTLLEAGAVPYAKNHDNRTPLGVARSPQIRAALSFHIRNVETAHRMRLRTLCFAAKLAGLNNDLIHLTAGAIGPSWLPNDQQ